MNVLINMLNELLTNKLSYADGLESFPGPHPHGTAKTCLWLVGVIACSSIYFLIYFSPVHLHDVTHFATAGVSDIRDHKDLLYPYHPHAAGGLGPAYEYLQNNTIHYDTRTNYPSKLYSVVYGSICAITGEMRLEYVQWMSFGAFLIGNVLLYLIGSRFFTGTWLICFLLSVMFLPVMRFMLNPGIDIYGYAGSLTLLWLCVCLRINPFVLGLYAGVLTHFRGQMLSILLVLPFVIKAVSGRSLLRQGLIPLSLGFAVTYSATSFIFSMLIRSTASGNPLEFYVNHFMNSTYGIHQLDVVLDKAISAIISIFDKTQLFFYPGIALFCCLRRNAPLQKNLAIASIVYTALPIALYSFDRFSMPAARYYMFAVPMIVLAGFIGIKMLEEKYNAIASKWGVYTLTILILFSWYNTYGFPFDQVKLASVKSRAQFLDFEGVEEALTTNFTDNDIVIVNHSLPTGLSRLHNVIYVPPFELFQRSDNSKISGIIFVYSNSPPNDFFKPKDWLQNDSLPNIITDMHGINFKQVYAQTSKILSPAGDVQSEAYFFIYKNMGQQ